MRALTIAALAIVIGTAETGPGSGAAGTEAAQAPATIGTLRGRVDIRRSSGSTERRPGVTELTMPVAAEVIDARPAVVYLENTEVPNNSSLRAGLADVPPRRGRMDQRDETFSPHVLAVTVGTTVDFPNNDRTYHNVFSLSKPKRFDLGRYGRGKSEPVYFDQPGIVRVFCDIHSHMSAFVLVFNHPYHTTTDAEGRYRIDKIPPGTYTVAAWHEGAVRDTKTVTIPSAAGPTDLDLLVQ
jgi:hypothetical protein